MRLAASIVAMFCVPAVAQVHETAEALHRLMPDKEISVVEAEVQGLSAAMVRCVAYDRDGDPLDRCVGLAIAPEVVVAPLQQLCRGVKVGVESACCDERPAAGVLAFDALSGLVLLRVPGMEATPLAAGCAALPDPLPEEVETRFRPPLRFEDAVMTGSDTRRVLCSLTRGFGSPRFRIDDSYHTLGAGTLVVDGQERPMAMTVSWAGNDRAWAVPLVAFIEANRPFEDLAAFGMDELLDHATTDEQRSALLGLRAGSELGRRDPASTDELREAVRLAPGNWAAWYELGVALDTAGEKEAAIAALRKSVEAEPGWSESWYSLGLVYLTSDQPAEAETAFGRAVFFDEEYADAQAMLGLARMFDDRPEEALAPMRRACELQPENRGFAENFALRSKRPGERRRRTGRGSCSRGPTRRTPRTTRCIATGSRAHRGARSSSGRAWRASSGSARTRTTWAFSRSRCTCSIGMRTRSGRRRSVRWSSIRRTARRSGCFGSWTEA
ncbi:MAG: tetratricopeptide repeat protein [Phycisphaerales bacterium]|jgi:Flp pilus assembly protein TadD|nr:tetratricopeptide repeat protein [Phycisphaerales bacterium]